MEFKVDEIVKAKIQNNRYKKQEWSKLRYLDTFLYVVSIYVPLFFIFMVLTNQTYSLFYASNGAITTSGRILTLAVLSISSYLILYLPYLILHIFLLYKTGKNILMRKKEIISINENNEIKYSYIDLLNKNKKHIVTIKLEDLEKISYMEEIKKIVLVGKNNIETIDLTSNKVIHKEENDVLDIYAYFKPDLLKELEKKDVKIEINFCF